MILNRVKKHTQRMHTSMRHTCICPNTSRDCSEMSAVAGRWVTPKNRHHRTSNGIPPGIPAGAASPWCDDGVGLFAVPPSPVVRRALVSICWGWPPPVGHEAPMQGVKSELGPQPRALQPTSAAAASVGLRDERRSGPD